MFSGGLELVVSDRKLALIQWRQHRILLTPAETEGRLGMFEAIVAPGFGPPRHIHHNEDETVLILDGEVRYWLDGEAASFGSEFTGPPLG